MIEINRNPSQRELNWFGALFALTFAVIGGMIWWRFNASSVAIILWSVAGPLTVIYYAAPPLRRPLCVGWKYATLPIALTVSYVALGIVYYLILTPLGLVMRVFGRDLMQRRLDSKATTYWIAHNPHGDLSRYFRQF